MQKNAGGWGTTLTLYINAPVVHCQLPLQSKTKNKQKKTDTHTHTHKKKTKQQQQTFAVDSILSW